MRGAPTVKDYERATDIVRKAAWQLIREEKAAIEERRVRIAEKAAARRAMRSQDEDTYNAARHMVPAIVAYHGDTPELQARRRAELERSS